MSFVSLSGGSEGLPFLKLGQTIFDSDFTMERLSGSKAGILKHWRLRLEISNSARKSISSAILVRLGVSNQMTREIPLLRFPIICARQDDRDNHFARLRSIGMGASKMYPGPVNEISEISTFFTGSKFPGAKALSARLLTVPTHHFVRVGDIERISELFKLAGGPIQTNPLILGNG